MVKQPVTRVKSLPDNFQYAPDEEGIAATLCGEQLHVLFTQGAT